MKWFLKFVLWTSVFGVLSAFTGEICIAADLAGGTAFKEPEFNPKFETSIEHRYAEEPDLVGRRVRKKKPKVYFRGYTKEKQLFNDLCFALYEDGRAAPLSKLSEPYKGGVKGCVACKSFFRLFFTYCKKDPPHVKKLKRIIKKRKMDPEADVGEEYADQEIPEEYVPPVSQLEPSIEVLDLASRVAITLAWQPRRREHHYPAVKLFVEQLRNPEKRTLGEIGYYDVLAEYFMAAFLPYEKARTRHVERDELLRAQREREFMFDTDQQFGGIEKSFDGQ